MHVNFSKRVYDLARIVNDAAYTAHVRDMRARGRDLRRRAFVGALTRAHAESHAGPITGVEIGVNYGAGAETILAECPFVLRLYLVDPWCEFTADHPDRQHHGYARRQPDAWTRVLNIALEKLPPFGGRAAVLRCSSLKAALAISAIGERVWFVNIDGGHSYGDVLADCRAWWPLVAHGGLLAGDDYLPLAKRKGDQRDDVSRAVDEFAASLHLSVLPLCRNWFIQKD